MPPIQHLLNIILFSVNVPVLSVKIYSTCPKSSLIAVFVAREETPVSLSNISRSQSINFAYKLFTRSRDTFIEMGIIMEHRSSNRRGIISSSYHGPSSGY
uniref:Uncharacterized protein n=1 Tax=Opuntia streptacantha TaxID=393608 RepID=A0A7C9E481_OPUST